MSSAPISLVDTLAVHSVVDPPKPLTVVVTEGIPPIPCRIVDRVRKRENVNLADLLGDHNPDHLTIINGQVIAVTSAGTPRRSCTISDIMTWLQAFSILTVILVSLGVVALREGSTGNVVWTSEGVPVMEYDMV